MKRNKNNIFILGFICILLIGIVFTVWIIKNQTSRRSKAAPSTTLLFDPATENVNTGDSFSSDIFVDPGGNFVSTAEITITYDSSALSVSPSDILPNSLGFPQILQAPSQPQCSQSTCSIFFSLGTGSDPTKIITSKTKVATVTFKAAAQNSISTTVTFDQSTKIYSTSPSDTARQNVLSTTSPLTVNIGNGNPTPPVCQANVSVCQWDQMNNTSSYHVKIEDLTKGKIVLEQDVQGSNTSLTFPSQGGITYKCTVTGSNSCGQSQPGIGTQTCPLPSPTPSNAPSPSPTACPAPQGVTNLQIICSNCNTSR